MTDVTSLVQVKDQRVARFYLIGLLATIGHLLDGHHLIGADVMSLMWKVEG